MTGEAHDIQMKSCESLVTELMANENAWPFLKPVSKKDVSCFVVFRIFHYLSGKVAKVNKSGLQFLFLSNPVNFLGTRLLRHYKDTDGLLQDSQQDT